jgi:hypothetical protein
MAVTAAGFFGLALKFGKKTNAMKVCSFLDKYIHT